MTERRISVSHEAIGGAWDSIEGEVQRQLPLKNLHWKSKSSSRPGIRTIQSLNINLVPLASVDDKAPSILERPYLHLLFVFCDDNEVYRATLRSQIREWLDGIIARPNQEWLIAHVSSGRSASSKFYQRKASVVDKIRTDFNTGRKDRCVQVAQFVSAEDPTTWAEFQTKMKEGIIATFDTNVGLYEEDVRKADSQRQLEGWQYTTFFLQKEGLADCFETMGLLEEALIQYDELEASFFQTLKENRSAWFGKIGGIVAGDDALPLLSTSNKPYRQLILSNTISIFDFRIYLFARQAAILFQLGRIAEVARRGAFFISQFTRTLRENQATLGSNFLESWTYSACLNIVDECTRRAAEVGVDQAVADSLVGVKAELLDLARKQLDKIGIGAGHLPMDHPFSMSLNEYSPDRTSPGGLPTASRDAVSRTDLREAISNREHFDKLYIDLTNRAIQAYQTTNRKRCSLKLHASLAALEDHRERPVLAQKLYSHLPAHYVDLRWVKIESALLAQCTRLQGSLDMPKEKLLSTLALVRAGVEYGSKVWTVETAEHAEIHLSEQERMADLAQKLMDDVYTLSSMLNKDFAAIAFPTFSMSLASNRGAAAIGEDGMTVGLLIRSLIPCPLNIDEVRLKFSTTEGEQIWFISGTCTISPGVTPVTLFCPTAMSGRLALELSQIRFSRIIFQYSHRPVSNRNLAPDPRNLPLGGQQPIIHFPRDPQALNVYTELPRAIHLDQHRRVVFCIATGRNQLVKVSLKVAISNPNVSLALASAVVIQGTARLVDSPEDESLLIEGVAASSVVKIEVPLIGMISNPIIELSIAVEYFTSKRPSTRRGLRRTVQYPIALPLAVNVQDYFRRDCLLSKFAVTTDLVRTLRIKSAFLEGCDGVEVKACRSLNAPTITLLPLQSANFLFKIVQVPSPSPKRALRLSLTYCSVQDEFLVKINSAVSTAVAAAAASLEDDLPWFSEAIGREVEGSTNIHSYSMSGTLSHLVFRPELWVDRVRDRFTPATQAEALALIGTAYSELANAPATEHPDAWRTLTIPVELPSLTILNLVRISPAYTRTEVGQPLPVAINIRPAFNWTSPPLSEPTLLSYEVNGTFDDWLVSGRKRGEFTAENGKDTNITLTLIPLRAGSLFLPSLSIRPAVVSDSITCETQHANAATMVEIHPIVARTAYTIDLAHQDRAVSYVEAM